MFRVGKPVTGADFYDRIKMLAEVKQMIASRQDFMIKAPRRYGKTSLIKQALEVTKSNYLYLDLRRESRMESIAEQIVDFAYSRAGINGFFKRLRDGAVKFLNAARHEIKIKTEIFEYTVEFFSDERKKPCELLMQALLTAELIAAEIGEEFIVVFDEFQDMIRFTCDGNVLELMRGTIQHQEHVMYAFLGSIEHLMTEIFENRKSPFYNYCRKLKLPAFDTDELAPQLITALKKRQIVFKEESDLNDVLKRLVGHPTNTMLVMQQIYYIALDLEIKSIGKKEIDDAYEYALGETTDLIKQYIHEMKGKKHHYDVVCRLARGEEQEMKGQWLNQVYNGLLEMGYINKVSRGEYVINDGFLVDYIKGESND